MNSLFVNLFNALGGSCLLRKTCTTPLVIYWHGVAHSYHDIIESECISSIEFEKEIQYLIRHYEVISLDEYYKRYINHSFTNREVVITFDDGYKNNLTVAAPILKKFNLPFTIFISTGNIETGERFYVLDPRLIIVGAELNHLSLKSINKTFEMHDLVERKRCAYEIERLMKTSSLNMALQIDNELRTIIGVGAYSELCRKYSNMEPLTWDEVRVLQDNYLCTIGSHTIDHCCCHGGQDRETLAQQIIESKKTIEEHTGRECNYFAYPNGDFTDESDALVADFYKIGFSTRHHPVYADGERIASVGRVSSAHKHQSFKVILGMQANPLLHKINLN